jgi:hypothetical protein
MPPPTQFAGGFFGDYTGLAADKVAYPAWSDTRNPAPVLCPGSGTPGHPPRLCVTPAPNAPYNDQEIYVAAAGSRAASVRTTWAGGVPARRSSASRPQGLQWLQINQDGE